MAYKFQLGAATLSGSAIYEGDVTAKSSALSGSTLDIGGANLTAAELEVIDAVSAGTAAASKALVVDGSRDIANVGNITSTGNITAGGSFIIGGADLNETDLEKLDGITNGTGAANKALVLDASSDISGIRNLTSTGVGTFAAGLVPNAADGAALGSAAKEWSDLYLADGGIVYFGDDQDVKLEHVSDSGLNLHSKNDGAANATSLVLNFSSSSPADNDEIGKLAFKAFNDNEQNETFGQILMKSTDVSDGNEDGSMEFATFVAGTPTSFININGTAASTVTFADGAIDVNIASHDGTNGLKLEGTLVTADAAELNKLDGYTGTTAELNTLDVTAQGTSEASKVVTADSNGDIVLAGATSNIQFDKSANELQALDGSGFVLGTGRDTTLIHNGGQSYVSSSVALNLATLNSGVAVSIGHTTSEVTINDNLTVVGNLTVQGAAVEVQQGFVVTASVQFEGSTPDGNELTLTTANPTADRTVTIPDLDGHIPLIAGAIGNANVTAAEFLLLDGGSTISSATVVDGDGVLFNDGGTMKQLRVQDLKSYIAGGSDVALKDDTDDLVNGVNYFANLGGAESCNLPSDPSVGDSVKIKAPANCSSTNTLTINRQGSHTIDGETAIVLESPHAAVECVYVVANTWKVF